MPPWAEARTKKCHSRGWRKEVQGKRGWGVGCVCVGGWRWGGVELHLTQLHAKGLDPVGPHDWSPTVSPMGLLLPISWLQL